MKLDIYDVDKFVTINELPMVTNPITLDRGNQPSIDGVLSVDIFGRDQYNRRERFGYIDLHSNFFHPVIFKNIRRLDRRIDGICSGQLYVEITDKGEILESDENNGHTGIDYIYKNYDKIKFKENDSMIRQMRTDMTKAVNKKEAFVSKWVILPPFYRDINYMKDQKVSIGDINQLYVKLIRLCNSISSNDSSLAFILHNTKFEIQKTLVEIYDYFMDNIKGKNGIFRQAVLGKSVDYASRLVISTHKYNAEQPEDETVSFYKCKLPIDHCVGEFKPFIIHWVKNFFTNEFITKEKYPVLNDKGEIEYLELDDPASYFNEKYIDENISKFIHSGNLRFDKIEVPIKDSKKPRYLVFKGRYYDRHSKKVDESPLSSRPMTWTDLLYLACMDSLKDKHVLLTRYPVTDQFSIVPNKIHVATTFETVPMFIDDKFYEHYPKVDLEHSNPETLFENTLIISNVFLSGLGGDFDGDQLSARPIMSQEANIEAENLINSKKMHLSVRGDVTRNSSNELIQTLYNFTK